MFEALQRPRSKPTGTTPDARTSTLIPPRWRRLLTFLAAMWRFARSGFRLSDWRETRRRRDICHGCEKKVGPVCTACGCFIRPKTRIAAQSCPLGKWNRDPVAKAAPPPEPAIPCKTCGDPPKTPPPPPRDTLPLLGTGGPIVRNLLYHIWPVARHDLWQRNLDELLKRIDLFNGRRVMAIVTDSNTVPPDEVKAYLDGHGFEFLVMPNNPKLREVITFVPLLEHVRTLDPNHVTFYAHAKSVRHTPGSICWRWAKVMYELNCDYWPNVEKRLNHFAMAGAFKKHGAFGPPHVGPENHRWHYSGTFFWFATKDAARVPPPCAELLSLLYRFPVGECFAMDGLFPDCDLHGAGLHAIPAGGRLGVHVDARRHPLTDWRREASGVLFLNEHWREDWGGELELWNADTSECVIRIPVAFNRLVIFATTGTSYHGIPQPISCPPEECRKTLACFWWSQSATDDLRLQSEFVNGPAAD